MPRAARPTRAASPRTPLGPLPRPRSRSLLRAASPVVASLVALLLAAGLLAASPAAAEEKPNPVTPGSFTGYGFDQCLAPEQWKMDRWLESSPFFAVGIYISGTSRGCRSQPNLTPAWVRTQLRKGWRLLPITLGPQASCHPGFPRYSDDRTIDPRPGRRGRYPRARRMGRAEADSAVAAAKALGLRAGSTLWYDLEGFDVSNTHCRESALAFLSGWSARTKRLGWVSGVYSSAGSGLKALDDARVNRPGAFVLPERIWIARWDGVANTSTSYLREDGWRPGGRVKQYRGDHVETWGGVSINIDSNYLDVGKGAVGGPAKRCGGTRVSFRTYPLLAPPSGGDVPPSGRTKAVQCLLRERKVYDGKIDGDYSQAVAGAVAAWREKRGLGRGDAVGARVWMSLLAAGGKPVVKVGSAGPEVRRLQRALNASSTRVRLVAGGVFDADTGAALRRWQGSVGIPATGILTRAGWRRLVQGRR